MFVQCRATSSDWARCIYYFKSGALAISSQVHLSLASTARCTCSARTKDLRRWQELENASHCTPHPSTLNQTFLDPFPAPVFYTDQILSTVFFLTTWLFGAMSNVVHPGNPELVDCGQKLGGREGIARSCAHQCRSRRHANSTHLCSPHKWGGQVHPKWFEASQLPEVVEGKFTS